MELTMGRREAGQGRNGIPKGPVSGTPSRLALLPLLNAHVDGQALVVLESRIQTL